MEESSVIKTLGQPVSHTAKPPSVPSQASKSGRSESSGNQTAGVPDERVGGATVAQPSEQKVNLAEAKAVVEDLNHQLEVAHHTLRFHIDDATEEIKVQVVDKETGKVVRTIPPEPSLSILASGEFSGLFSVQG